MRSPGRRLCHRPVDLPWTRLLLLPSSRRGGALPAPPTLGQEEDSAGRMQGGWSCPTPSFLLLTPIHPLPTVEGKFWLQSKTRPNMPAPAAHTCTHSSLEGGAEQARLAWGMGWGVEGSSAHPKPGSATHFQRCAHALALEVETVGLGLGPCPGGVGKLFRGDTGWKDRRALDTWMLTRFCPD